MLKDKTAAELADALDVMRLVPHNTGGMSMLDEATLAFGDLSIELGEAQRAFAEARYQHQRSYRADVDRYSDDAWSAALDAAARLADLLRKTGDVRIARCARRAGWGTCGLPLTADGECRSTLGHTT